MLLIGILSIFGIIYCFIMNILHIIWSYKRVNIWNQNPDRASIYLSMISMIFIAICPLFLCLSYWIPLINNYCLCKLYFILNFVCYSTSQYCSKFIYIYKGILLSKDRNNNQTISISIKICIFLLIIGYIVSLVAIGTICDGECQHNDHNINTVSCIIKINGSFYFYLCVLGLLIIDGLIYSKCCYQWYKTMKSLANKGNFTNEIVNKFMILFIGTTIMLILSIITITTNAIWINYNTLNILIIDCILNSTLQIFIHNHGKMRLINMKNINNINNISNIQNDDGINQSSPLSIDVMSANSTNVDNSINFDIDTSADVATNKYKQNNLYPISEIIEDDDESMTLFSEII